jgi:hypothetical protein
MSGRHLVMLAIVTVQARRRCTPPWAAWLSTKNSTPRFVIGV